MMRYEIRAAVLHDAEQLLALAQHLNTVNLPSSRDAIKKLLEVSERSFSGALAELGHRRYMFVLSDLEQGVSVGTSSLIAQLGRRDAPYIYFDVLNEERYSRTLDRHFRHTLLRLGLSYDGPTELGGLVVDPKYRRAPERLGLLISYVRFLFLAAHAEWFREQLLAELLPPLEPDGTSHLWEALGRCFTGLSYREADLLSSENKDFIVDLFPSGVIYSTLLSAEAQSVIGKVGAPTKGVEKLLRRVGFRYAHRIDPFDGGPHFVATRSEVAPIQMVRKVSYSEEPVPEGTAVRCLVARELTEPPYFRAIACSVKFAPDGRAVVEREGSEHLNLAAGENVWCLPLP